MKNPYGNRLYAKTAVSSRLHLVDQSDALELVLYGEIGVMGISASSVEEALADAPRRPLTVRVNTYGGDVFDGITIYQMLRRWPEPVTVWIDGLAASIGSVIALAGRETIAYPSSMLMLHEPWSIVIGNASDMRSMGETLERIAAMLVGIYAGKIDQDPDEIRSIMQEETWLTAEQAKTLGLVDRVDDGESAPALDIGESVYARARLQQYRHAPETAVQAFEGVRRASAPEPSGIDLTGKARRALALRERT